MIIELIVAAALILYIMVGGATAAVFNFWNQKHPSTDRLDTGAIVFFAVVWPVSWALYLPCLAGEAAYDKVTRMLNSKKIPVAKVVVR